MRGLHRLPLLTIPLLLWISHEAAAQDTPQASWWTRQRDKIVRYIAGEAWTPDTLLYTTHHKALFAAGHSAINDTYLSDITHAGKTFAFRYTLDRSTKKQCPRLYGDLILDYIQAKNKGNGRVMQQVGGELSIGPLWRIARIQQVAIDIAPLYNTSVRGVIKLSNSNNVFDLKASTGLDLMVRGVYQTKWKHFPMGLMYQAQVSALHLTFAPEYGQLYYDFVSGEKQGKVSINLTTPANRLALRQRLLIDLPIHHTTWTIGVEHNLVEQNLQYNRYRLGTLCAVFGISFDALTLSGGKSLRSRHVHNSLY